MNKFEGVAIICKTCGCAGTGNEQIHFKLGGITLFNKKKVEKMLLGLPGVYHVHLHFMDGQALLDYNPRKISVEQLKEKITENGFSVV